LTAAIKARLSETTDPIKAVRPGLSGLLGFVICIVTMKLRTRDIPPAMDVSQKRVSIGDFEPYRLDWRVALRPAPPSGAQ
jgi:hypothetical protein